MFTATKSLYSDIHVDGYYNPVSGLFCCEAKLYFRNKKRILGVLCLNGIGMIIHRLFNINTHLVSAAK